MGFSMEVLLDVKGHLENPGMENKFQSYDWEQGFEPGRLLRSTSDIKFLGNKYNKDKSAPTCELNLLQM